MQDDNSSNGSRSEHDDELAKAVLSTLDSGGSPSEHSELDDLEDLEDLEGAMDWQQVLEDFPALPSAAAEEDDDSSAHFYRLEASSLQISNAERASLMLLEAALAGEQEGAGAVAIQHDLERALSMRPKSTWLLPASRRLLVRLGQYERALELCLSEVAITPIAQHKTPILLEAATLERYVRRRPEQALALVNEALAHAPRHVFGLSGAFALQTELVLYADAADHVRQLASALSSPVERALALYSCGTLQEARLGQLDDAETTYQSALEADASHLPAMSALCELLERRGRWQPLSKHLEALVELVPDAESTARALYQAAALHLDHDLDSHLAAQQLARAIKTVPPQTSTLWRLAQAHKLRGGAREAVLALRGLLALAQNDEQRASLLTEIGWLQQTQLGLPEDALAAYRGALEAVHLFAPAYARLRSLLDALGREDALADLLEHAASTVSDDAPLERATRYVELAEHLAGQGRDADAVRAFDIALQSAPALHSAFWGLNRLLTRLQRHEARRALLEDHIARCDDTKTKTHLLGELGRLLAGPLGDVEGAVVALIEHAKADRNRGLALDLIELHVRAGDFDALADALLREARDTTDADERYAWMIHAARVQAEMLEAPEVAIATLNALLELRPAHPVAIAEVQRIAHEHGLWDDTIAVSEHLLEHGGEELDRTSLFTEIGRAHVALGRVSEAIVAFENALEVQPDAADPAALLEELLRTQKRWADCVSMLEQYAASCVPETADAALCRAAEIADSVLGELELAERLYRQASEVAPDPRKAKYGVARVLARRKRWKQLAEALRDLLAEQRDDEEHSRLLLALVRVEELWLDDVPDLDLASQAAQRTQFEPHLRMELTRMRRVVGSDDLPEWLEALGAQTEDAQLAAAYFLESTHRFEFERHASDAALAPARQAYARTPDEQGVVWAMERVLLAAEDWDDLARLRERGADLAPDPAARVQTLTGAIRPHINAGELDDARRVARDCLNFDAHCLPALRALAELAEQAGRWDELAVLCDRLAEACHAKANRFTYWLTAAELWEERVGDDARALASLAVALSYDPTHESAFEVAERLLRKRRDFSELSRLFTRRITASDEEARVELLRGHAEVLAKHLADLPRASSELDRLLAARPDDIVALQSQADLLGTQGRWAEAAACQERIATVTHDPKVRYDATIARARILLDRLRQPQRATTALAKLLEEYPEDLGVQKELVALHVDGGHWSKARDVLEIIADKGDVGDRVWAMIKLADVARRALWAEHEQRSFESRALQDAVHTPEVLAGLVEDYRQRHELPRLIEIGQALLRAGSDPDEDVSLKRALAGLLVDVGQVDEAIGFLDQVLDSDDTGDAREIRARTLEADGRLDEAITAYRNLIARDPEALDPYAGLVRALDKAGYGDAADAVAAVMDLIAGEPLDPEDDEIDALPSRALALEEYPLDFAPGTAAEIFEELGDYLGALYSTDIPGTSIPAEHPASRTCQRLAQSIGLPDVRVVVVDRRADQAPCSLRLGKPLVLVLDTTLTQAPRSPRTVFWVARTLALSSQPSAIVEQLDNAALDRLWAAITERKPADPDARALLKRLLKLMPRKHRKVLKSFEGAEACSWSTWRRAERSRTAFAAAAISRSPRVALQELAASKSHAIVDFFLSQEYQSKLDALWGSGALSTR